MGDSVVFMGSPSAMSPSARFNSAIQAMKDIGIPPKTTKSVLKNLLKIYDNKWDLIEEESHRTLADAIFEWQEAQEREEKNVNENAREREEDYSEYEPPQTRSRLRIMEPSSSSPSVPLLPYHDTPCLSKKPIVEETSVPLKRRRRLILEDSPESPPASLECLPYDHASSAREPSVKAVSPSSVASGKSTHYPSFSSLRHDKDSSHSTLQTSETEHFAGKSEVGGDIPLSIVLHPSSLEKPDKGNRVSRPVYSLHKEEDVGNDRRNKNAISPANGSRPHDAQSSLERMQLPHVRQHIACDEGLRKSTKVNKKMPENVNLRKKEAEALTFQHSPETALAEENHDFFCSKKPLHDVFDISKGEEKVRVPVINEVNNEPYPPVFHYIPKNLVYQNAYVNFSLARIGDEDCCASCFGNCLLEPIPCACARETDGEYAYTTKGLVKKEILDEAISVNHRPEKQKMLYCKDCPLERSNNAGPCKGHLFRRFIKECWSKCGCSKQCGNRVVQRGITINLQVFLTREGKGWGLRTLERLPRGAFVCEYVGEIVTNTELFYRNEQRSGEEKHTYPVLLDADWGSEGVLKDEEALCLDATYYGNVARFINHRCFDATLVEIPVEIETPDHHYYHLSFFTTREVEPLEELTWVRKSGLVTGKAHLSYLTVDTPLPPL